MKLTRVEIVERVVLLVTLIIIALDLLIWRT